MSDGRPRTRPTFLRALSLIALLLFAGIADSLHQARAAHAICPEHGELIHVAFPTHVRVAHAQTAPVVAPATTGGIQHHDHCVLASFVRANSASWLSCAATTLPIAECAAIAAPLDASVRVESVPLLLLAPKHSPPVS